MHRFTEVAVGNKLLAAAAAAAGVKDGWEVPLDKWVEAYQDQHSDKLKCPQPYAVGKCQEQEPGSYMVCPNHYKRNARQNYL